MKGSVAVVAVKPEQEYSAASVQGSSIVEEDLEVDAIEGYVEKFWGYPHPSPPGHPLHAVGVSTARWSRLQGASHHSEGKLLFYMFPYLLN